MSVIVGMSTEEYFLRSLLQNTAGIKFKDILASNDVGWSDGLGCDAPQRS